MDELAASRRLESPIASSIRRTGSHPRLSAIDYPGCVLGQPSHLSDSSELSAQVCYRRLAKGYLNRYRDTSFYRRSNGNPNSTAPQFDDRSDTEPADAALLSDHDDLAENLLENATTATDSQSRARSETSAVPDTAIGYSPMLNKSKSASKMSTPSKSGTMAKSSQHPSQRRNRLSLS
jgi:hypothetical protein